MKSIFIAVLFSFLPLFASEIDKQEMGNLVLENIPEIPVELSERLLQYQNVRGASFRDWDTRSNSIIISTRDCEFRFE